MCSIGFKSGDRDGHDSTLNPIGVEKGSCETGCNLKVLRRALISSFHCFVGGYADWSENFVLIPQGIKGKTLTTIHCVLIIFCDFQNYTSNDQNAISAYFAS